MKKKQKFESSYYGIPYYERPTNKYGGRDLPEYLIIEELQRQFAIEQSKIRKEKYNLFHKKEN